MNQKLPLAWVIVFLLICATIVAIMVSGPSQPSGESVEPLIESDDAPRVETLNDMMENGENAVFVEDQESGAEDVIVGLAVLQEPGFVVIHKDDDGIPGDVIGYSMWILDGAEHFFIGVEEPLEEDEIYYAMLYTDNGDQEWNVQTDLPVTGADGAVTVMTFSARVGAAPESGVVIP